MLSEKLNVNHRRIPILALGRDIYIDTRLILRKLETLFPDSKAHPTLGAKDGFGKGFEEMLEGWVIDAGPFWRASGCIPLQAPLLKNEVWVKDRFDGSGGAFTKGALTQGRKWCLSQLRIFFGVMENVLSDGRKWVLGDVERPGLADIHGCWVYDWGINMAGDMFVTKDEAEEACGDMKEVLNEHEFPMVHEWVRRFKQVCDQAKRSNAGAQELGEGEVAEDAVVKRVLNGDFVEPDELDFYPIDILGLKKGQFISIAPADFGFTHSDRGALVGLTTNEVVIEVAAGRRPLRLHYPRIDFKISPVDEGS